MDKNNSDLDLSNLGLTSLFHLDHLLHVTSLNLSQNALTSLGPFECLQSLRKLDLSGNDELKICTDVLREKLPKLEEIRI